MASKLHQLQAKACQATQFVTKHGSVYYKQLMEQNKQYIKDPTTVETCSELSKQLFYTRLASIPGVKSRFGRRLSMWKNRQDSVLHGIVLVRLLVGNLRLLVTIPEATLYVHLDENFRHGRSWLPIRLKIIGQFGSINKQRISYSHSLINEVVSNFVDIVFYDESRVVIITCDCSSSFLGCIWMKL